MDFRLSECAAAAGYRLATFETIGSTNAEALLRARAGDAGSLWLVTDHQSAGTGRRGAAWRTPRGNLAATLLLTTDLPPSTIAQLGFVAGVALVEALDRTSLRHGEELGAPRHDAAGRPFRLKWPNDVMAGSGKLAGILLGTEAAGGRRAVAVGIGINVAHAPDDLPYPAASLRDLGSAADAAHVFEALADAWLDAFEAWDDGRGFEAIRRSWLARAAGVGGDVAVRIGTNVTRGIFETIDPHGQLVVRSEDGREHRVSAGEVLFGAAGTARPELHA